MRRSPKEVVDTLSYALKEGKQGDEYRVSDLVKKTSMNHITVSYYLDLIMHVQKNMPSIEVVEKKRNSIVKILKEIEMPLSETEQILISLFDKGAFNKAAAVSIAGYQKDALAEILSQALLAEASKKIYLMPDGILAAAELADRRAEFAISPIKRNLYESGEILIDEWKVIENVEEKTKSDSQGYLSVVCDIPTHATPLAI